MFIHSTKTSLITAIVFMLVTMPLISAAEGKAKSFKDWGYKCEQTPDKKKEICFVFQRISSKKDDKRIADVTIAYLPNIDKPVMVITLPLGVLLPPGIQIGIDEEKKGVRVPFAQCTQAGCQARIALEDKMITKMKGGKQMVVAFISPPQKQLGFPISLSGFTAALGSLKK